MDFKRWWSEQEIFCGDGGMDAAELAWDYCHEEITRLRAELAEVEGQEEKLVEIIRRSYLLGVDDAAEGQAAWCRQGSEEKATELLQEMRTDADLFAHPAPAKVSDIPRDDLDIQQGWSSVPHSHRGQHARPNISGVRVRQKSTGIEVCCDKERAAHMNLAVCMAMLKSQGGE